MRTFGIIIIILLITSNLTLKTNACGWYENPEAYRISAFRAEIAQLLGYRAFYYTPELLNAYLPGSENNDLYKNCEEWQKIIGGKIRMEDIFTILYKVEPDLFFLSYNDKKLDTVFEGNTFISELLKKKNKEWLEYLAFAKKNEYNNMYSSDPWKDTYEDNIGSLSHELLNTAEQKLHKIKNTKLLERYAYHLIRLYRQTGEDKKCIEAYDNYFGKSKSESVLKTWSLLHKAEALSALGEKVKANYLYSIVFNLGEEKRIRAYKLFSKDLFEKTLALAKNKTETATLWAIMAIKNPGPALKEIKKVIENDPQHHAIPILIMREVNKLEDWIFTPQYSNHSPSVHYANDYNDWNEKYQQIKNNNKKKDLIYLKELNAFLRSKSSAFRPEIVDYLKLASAHLHLIVKENKAAFTLFNSISDKAGKAIRIQKNVELALFYVFENNLSNVKVQEQLAKILFEIDKLSKNNNLFRKQIHSLCEIISQQFLNGGNVPYAGLFQNRAEDYKHVYEDTREEWSTTWQFRDYYFKIAYFDRFASPKDIDTLIDLIEKENKTTLEKYLCDQQLASKNALLDLKGTLALRNGQIEVANEAFTKVSPNFWSENYSFGDYLHEDPFRPPNTKRSAKAYHFNKAKLLNELVKLKEEAISNSTKAAENYIKLGHFYYRYKRC